MSHSTESSLSLTQATRDELTGYSRLGILAGAVGAGGLGILGILMPESVMPAYLTGFIYWVGVSIACILLVMLHYLVGGNWGYPIKRMAEAGALVVAPMGLLFVPIAIAAPRFYPWLTHIDDEIRKKQAYLNYPFWVGRAIAFFVIWAVVALVLNNWSKSLDRNPRSNTTWWAKTLSGPGIILVFMTASFASIDWMMSLEPHWFSSLYAPLVIVGWGLTTWALAVIAMHLLSPREPYVSAVTPGRLHDIGNLMFAFTIIWAYMSFMQFLITWAGNLSEEIPFYLRRVSGGWQILAIVLMILHFFLPFFVLLFRDVKRGTSTLAVVATWLLVMRVIDLTWVIVPFASNPAAPRVAVVPVLLVPVAVVAIGLFWLGCFLFFLPRRPVLPANDPGIPAEALVHAGGH
jgi:hypothetical protein